MIYFDDECLQYVEMLENRGTLINHLVKEHFSNSEDVIKTRIEALRLEQAQLETKLIKSKEKRDREAAKKVESELSKLMMKDTSSMRAQNALDDRIKKLIDSLKVKPKNSNEFISMVKKEFPQLEWEIDISWEVAYKRVTK